MFPLVTSVIIQTLLKKLLQCYRCLESFERLNEERESASYLCGKTYLKLRMMILNFIDNALSYFSFFFLITYNFYMC